VEKNITQGEKKKCQVEWKGFKNKNQNHEQDPNISHGPGVKVGQKNYQRKQKNHWGGNFQKDAGKKGSSRKTLGCW